MATKLDVFRKSLRDGREKFGKPIEGVSFYELLVDLNMELAPTFFDFQGLLYKQQISTQFLTYFLLYWDSCRQMFSFDPALADSLNNTDVSDVPWEEIRLPYQEFHVDWGDFCQESFSIADLEYVVDGAYIKRVSQESSLFPNDTILITFTSKLVCPSYKEARKSRSADGFHFSEPIYQYAISGAEAQTVGEAIEKGEYEYSQYCDHLDNLLLKSARDLASEVGVVPVGERIYPFRDKFERSVEIIRESVPLLFNVIFYLTQRPGEREVRFPETAPRGKVKRLMSENSESARRSIRDSLARKGYSEVTFVRDPEVTGYEDSLPTNRTTRAHWRRGHWRNQPYGKNLTKRKWLWIRPVLVKKEEKFELGTKHKVMPNPKDLGQEDQNL